MSHGFFVQTGAPLLLEVGGQHVVRKTPVESLQAVGEHPATILRRTVPAASRGHPRAFAEHMVGRVAMGLTEAGTVYEISLTVRQAVRAF